MMRTKQQEQLVERQFDHFCRTVLANKNRDLIRQRKRLQHHEPSLCVLPSSAEPFACDVYFTEEAWISLGDYSILVCNTSLARFPKLKTLQQSHADFCSTEGAIQLLFFCRGIPGTLPVPVFCLFSPPFKGYGKLHSTLPQPLNGYRYTASNPGLCVNPKGFPQSFFVRPFLKK